MEENKQEPINFITKLDIEKKIIQLKHEREKVLAQFHSYNGAIEILEKQIIEFNL